MLNESNYFSREMSEKYCGSSQFKEFVGIRGVSGCEARALAKIKGDWVEKPSTAMLVGSYVDAHFEGTLDIFKAQNPSLFKRDGMLKSTFVKAEEVIARAERDPLFMEFMAGEKQIIMTANFFNTDWKIKIDSYHPSKAIVDLKVMATISKTFYLPDQGRVNFIENWGYDYQAAIYQKVVEINTGEKLPFYIAALSKEDEPDISVIQLEQHKIDEALNIIETNMTTINRLKNREIEPVRCENCAYCRNTKVLSAPIMSSELLGD